jgi:hypothetical protein
MKVFEEYYQNCFHIKEREEGMGRGMILWKHTVGDIHIGKVNEDEYYDGSISITEYLRLP